MRRCVPGAGLLYLFACASSQLGTVPAGGACTRNADCLSGLVCFAGKCAPPAAVCDENATRCHGDDVETCVPDRGWTYTATCPAGCARGKCVDPVCTPGERSCEADGKTLRACNSRGTEINPIAFCVYGCDAAGAGCVVPSAVCFPLIARCKDPTTLETCKDDGSAWIPTPCAVGTACEAGDCRAVVCGPGATRCLDAVTVGTCNATGTGWVARSCAANDACAQGACKTVVCAPNSATCRDAQTVSVCNPTGTGATEVACGTGRNCIAGTCGGTVCTHGLRVCSLGDVQVCRPDGSGFEYLHSCGGACATGACATAGCAPFTFGASTASIPADGASTVLVSSVPITDGDGVPVPDGTPFTLETSGGEIAAADADLATPGVQVLSFKGRIDFRVRAPSAPTADGGPAPDAGADDGGSIADAGAPADGGTGGGVAIVTARHVTASKCAGSTTLSFVAASPSAYAAEDFTSSAAADVDATTVRWNTELGHLRGDMAPVFGDGADGDLYVGSGSTYVLTANAHPGRVFPDAVEYAIRSISGATVTVAAMPFGIELGDDVLLVNLGGDAANSASAGNYEVQGVTAVDLGQSQVTVARPVARTYGAGDNANFAGQNAVVRRVPRYRDAVVVGTVGAAQGLVFFKASRTVSLLGSVNTTAQGYAGGVGTQGASFAAPAQAACSANQGGGGAGSGLTRDCSCTGACAIAYSSGAGGGGGHGAAGGAGGCAAGAAYGDARLSRWYKGSGGGGGPCTTYSTIYCCATCFTNTCCLCRKGGNGGGIVAIWSPAIAVNGQIAANGESGAVGSGGGAGGTVFLRAATLALGTNRVRAEGGVGGGSGAGAGGEGRIRLDGAATGTTSPAATVEPPVTATARSREVDATALGIAEATIVSAIADAAGGTVNYYLSNDAGQTWQPATVGTPVAFPDATPSALVWRADFAGSNPGTLSISGISLSYVPK